MFSPPSYIVRKIPLRYIIDNSFVIQEQPDDENYFVDQQDNSLFRQIRLLTYDDSKYNKFIVFVDCSIGKNYPDHMKTLITKGFKWGKQHFVPCERSASMVRTAMLSFIDSRLSRDLNQRITMDIEIGKTALSKYYAYRGLMLSSCHCLEDWYPKIVIVPDAYRTIDGQRIEYVVDRVISYTDKNGNTFDWKQKGIAEGTRDIEINMFDGCGIHHPQITEIVQEKLGCKTMPTSILWRAPYIKGVTHSMDYESFFAENGVEYITDVWGIRHDVRPGSEPMIIMTESMYKGKKYFKRTGTSSDWDLYWEKFKKYKHCIGVAKWNFSLDEEPLYTRANYQILQDLDLPYEEFRKLASDSITWFEKIADGDPLYSYCFLGLMADRHKPLNAYAESVLKSPSMLKEQGVRNYILGLMDKYKDEFKCGKIWLRGTFKFLVPDLIALMQHIGGMSPNGCLGKDEFYSFDRDGVFSGERLIERNPHISRSEHVILSATNNEMIQKYCSHLVNVCMINCWSITPQRLNGADFDGDLVLVLDDKRLIAGVDRSAPIVIDIEDKITALEEEDTLENQYHMVMRGLKSMIGEISNYATAYHNKTPQTEEQRKKYNEYVSLLSVCNGKEIDRAKTGVAYPVPRQIAKFGRPLPYFMKYASPYYSTLKQFNRSFSNMNRLCFDIEKWEKKVRYRRTDKTFDYSIMIDKDIPFDQDKFDAIEKIYLEFCSETAELLKLYKMTKQWSKYEGQLKGVMTKQEAAEYEINWDSYYGKYRSRCQAVCPDTKELANYAVVLCYQKYPARGKKFMWRMAPGGIVENIKQESFALPSLDDSGEYEYLGKRYSFVAFNGDNQPEREE